jgi:hypothetical protein
MANLKGKNAQTNDTKTTKKKTKIPGAAELQCCRQEKKAYKL